MVPARTVIASGVRKLKRDADPVGLAVIIAFEQDDPGHRNTFATTISHSTTIMYSATMGQLRSFGPVGPVRLCDERE